MATPNEAPTTTPSVQVVGNAFVEQYYHILHHSPDMVHKFYQESSFISRPDEDGAMITVTTMKGINDKICSLDYTTYKAEIKTADAQESYKDGVIVLVTGCLTKKEDNQKKKFIQSFFLAPQDKGYFVLNDVFRYVDEIKSTDDTNNINVVVVEGIDDNQTIPSIPDAPSQDVVIIDKEEIQTIEEEPQQLIEAENNTTEPEIQIHPIEESIEDTPTKLSYASILSSQKKAGPTPTKVYLPSTTPKPTPTKPLADVAPPEASAAPSISSPHSSTTHDEGDGFSVYVRNLPLNATVDQIESEFNKFGSIKPGGIQVRSNKLGFCFGFVEFLDFNSMQNAIQNSPVSIGGRDAVVEIKRTTTRAVGSGRGRFPQGRGGGFRNDTFRGRGFNGGGRGYGRTDFSGGRGRGGGGRGGEGGGYRGRGGRRGGSTQYVSPS